MRDRDTTLKKIKHEVIEMCLRKGWGDNGIQNPQHVTMAMVVEAMELLEHFVCLTPAEEAALCTGGMRDERIEIAEEMSDVLMYSMQLMYTLNVDVSRALCGELSDECSTIVQLKECAGSGDNGLKEQAMRVGIKSRFVLEEFQWMNDADVAELMKGLWPKKAADAGKAFAALFREILILANRLDIDIAAAIARKIAIVDKRVYPDDDPVR